MAEVQLNHQMADPISSGVNTHTVTHPKMPARVPEPVANDDKRIDQLRKEEITKKEDIRTREYGPVIARSSDGDTVRVKKEDIEDRDDRDKRENGGIYDMSKNEVAGKTKEEIPDVELPDIELKEYEPAFEYEPVLYEPGEYMEKTKQEAIKAQDSAREIYKEESIGGADSGEAVGRYSDSMLKEMYLKGDISEISYEREVEAREQEREARGLEDKKFSEDLADDTERLREMERTGELVRDVEKGEVNTSDNTAPLDDRLQAIQNADAM